MSHEGDPADAMLLARGEYARLLAKYEPVIVGRCVARLRGAPEAEDVAQDVKLRLWRELSKGKSYPVPFRVVVHQVIGWTVNDHFADRPTDVPLPENWDPADGGDAFGELLDDDVVGELLDRLPEGRTKDVMVLRFREQLEVDEICERLGIRAGNVYVRVHEGLAKLRETLPRG